jgi:NADH:ubiquinone oxidoreductase subunit 4 (subunit M)
LLVVLLASIAVGAWLAPSALAHMGAERFKIEKRVSTPPKGPRGQLEVHGLGGDGEARLLRGEGNDYVGSFEVRNTGPGPLVVNRVFVLDADDDPRSPPGLVAQPEGGIRSAIPPGQTRRWNVTWHAGEARARQLYAQLVVDSDAAQPDAKVVDPPKLVGVVADRRVGLARHVLSLLVALPLLLAALAGASGFVRALAGRTLSVAVTLVAAAEAALAAWAFFGLDRDFGRRDGNEGLQLVERALLSRPHGIELYLGVDGLSASVLFVVTLVVLFAVVASTSSRDPRRGLLGAGLLTSGVALTLASQTTVLLTGGWALSAVGAVVVTRDVAPRASAKIAWVGGLSSLCLAAGAHWLAGHAGTASLVDGTDTSFVTALPDLGRAHLAGELAPMLGLPGYRAAWLLTFVGAAAFSPLVPVHSWLADLAGSLSSDRATPWRIALVGALLPATSTYLVLRLCVLVELDGARWGGESLPVVGALLLAFAAVRALSERDLCRIGAHLVMGRSALFSCFAFALTPQALQISAGMIVSLPVAAALFFSGAGAIAAKTRDASLERVAGIGRSAPILSALVVGGAATLALPGLADLVVGFVGAVGRNPLSAFAAALALCVLALAAARAARSTFGAAPTGFATSKYLEPFGGAMPDLRRADLAWAVPLLVLGLALAIVPRAFVGPTDPLLRDLEPRLDPDGPTRVATLPQGAPEPSSHLDGLPT